jgi:hypothetical protein
LRGRRPKRRSLPVEQGPRGYQRWTTYSSGTPALRMPS